MALPPPLLSSIGPHYLVRALRSSMNLSEPGAVDPYAYTSEWKLTLKKKIDLGGESWLKGMH